MKFFLKTFCAILALLFGGGFFIFGLAYACWTVQNTFGIGWAFALLAVAISAGLAGIITFVEKCT